MNPPAAAMRLFIALELPAPVKAQLAALKADLPGAVWVKPAAMHLTLKFLGDGIEETRVPALIAALDALHAAPFELALAGVGRFPPGDRRPARVLWAGLSAPPALPALAETIERATGALGFPCEDRPFVPHLTLARFRNGGGGPDVARFLTAHSGLRSQPFAVSAFNLIASQLLAQGPSYTRLHEVVLRG